MIDHSGLQGVLHDIAVGCFPKILGTANLRLVVGHLKWASIKLSGRVKVYKKASTE